MAIKLDLVEEALGLNPPAHIRGLEVAFSDLSPGPDAGGAGPPLVLPSELVPVSAHCRRCLQPEDAFVAFGRYLRLSQERLEQLEGLSGAGVRAARDGEGVGVRVEFANDHGVPMCAAEWRLVFREDLLDFRDAYNVEFTLAGQLGRRGGS